MNRRSYFLRVTVNGRKLNAVVIDHHYELKHSSTITDELILELVALLDGESFDQRQGREALSIL